MHDADGTGTARVEPERLVAAAARYDALAATLTAAAAAVPVTVPDAGFASAGAAAALDAGLVAAVRADAGRAARTAGALRATATAWRSADDAAATSLGG
ncbi:MULTISPECIES: hypothetical protein [unclassified Pseudonocardia]|uniref:hypothetical protein n=1 Tax=unclassified Pseudonocardia TaxID=2619320 RepID=UPI0006CB6C15|nr:MULTISPECIES: hypothetical protein [unclassified Pseudonocardia]ALE72822.1 hypothetical protein FRP1_06355 [Pseudonocardia sp. EC080625-04]ALL76145.1 hypothetical protein AD006_13975 [Pseudonocardia sp. EC080610-09]ALL83169.1 hypothetical protein AD017_21800 [Pseudonocardia sp. EC080619-01]